MSRAQPAQDALVLAGRGQGLCAVLFRHPGLLSLLARELVGHLVPLVDEEVDLAIDRRLELLVG
eukprot:8393839-Lingulodinium_polyedra.AAC.1